MNKTDKKKYQELLKKEQARKEYNKKRNTKHKAYINKFQAETYCQMSFKLNKNKDAELIKFLKGLPNRTEWLRNTFNKGA